MSCLRSKIGLLLTWIFLALATVFPKQGLAQSWAPLAPQFGTGTGICYNSGATYQCLAIRCNVDDRYPRLVLYANQPGRLAKQDAILVVDQNKPQVGGLVQDGQNNAWLWNANADEILAEMAVGQKVTLFDQGRFDVGLAGARAEIDRTLAACAAVDKSNVASVAELLENQSNRVKTSSNQLSLRYLKQSGARATALASGLNDPALRGIGVEACAAACVARGDCTFATYTEGQNICALSSGLGPIVPDQRSFTVMVTGRPEDPAISAFQGPPPLEMTGLRWKPGEDWQGYVARLRDASVPLGGDCQAEANVVGQFLQNLKLSPPALKAIAGQPVSLGWTSTALSQRIPA